MSAVVVVVAVKLNKTGEEAEETGLILVRSKAAAAAAALSRIM